MNAPIGLLKKQVKDIEKYSGIQCAHVANLKENASIKEWNKAYEADKCWFKGWINDLELLL